MAHSIVKVTESQGNDSLLLVIGEDGTVSPDKETVESYLKNRPGATELQVMHVNKSDGRNIDITLDTMMYVHSEEIVEGEDITDMEELQRNLKSFRMDHDYTPLTSPKRPQSPNNDTDSVDELAQTLSLLEGNSEPSPPKPKSKSPVKVKRVITLPSVKQKAKMITSVQALSNTRQLRQVPSVPKIVKISKPVPQPEYDNKDEGDESNEDSDYDDELDFEDDDADSDFELEEKPKSNRKNLRRGKRVPEAVSKPVLRKVGNKAQHVREVIKSEAVKNELEGVVKETEKNKNLEKSTDKESEIKPEKKPPKKEKKVLKPPDDFALFSTPDIIRRVGGKDPPTPTTPTTPEIPKVSRPAKIVMENRSKSGEVKVAKRPSVDQQKRLSVDDKSRRPSVDKNPIKKPEKSPDKKPEGHVSVQGYDESLGSNSSESLTEPQLEPIPSAEDIRAIIQNENTKTFTTSLIIPDPPEPENNEPGQLESGGLELDQSILDNINNDLISEDILYQVAQSLAENPDLQNVIDKSIVDGNLILDPSLQSISEDNSEQQAHSSATQSSIAHGESSGSTVTKGTQIVRSDGRVVLLPPIERPTTRSRNRRTAESPEARQVTRPVKPLDEEHVSGNELDSSGDEEEEEEESEDDPNKLWCICNQPHNNRFMICCDTCEEWYHGKCVNVTKAMGQTMEQEGKEWICVYCRDRSLRRPTAAARRVRKASRTSRTSTDSSGSQAKQAAAGPSCIVCGKPSRNSSIYCSDGCILRHARGVEKVVVFDRRTGKTLSGNAAPSAANLERWLREHPGFEVARARPKKLAQSKLQLVRNSGNEGVSLAVNRKGVHVGVLQHAPKPDSQAVRTKSIMGVKILNKNAPTSTPQKMVKLIHPLPSTRPHSTPTTTTTTVTTTPSKPKILNSGMKQQTTPSPKEKVIVMKTPKARQAELGVQQPKQENIRENVRKTLMEQLTNRLKMVEDLKLTPEEVTNISNEIETQLYKCFGDTGQKYRTKYRSLIFNIKDVKNQTLWRRICEKSINPYQLVRLSHDDLASQELAMWRQREAKHQLDMIEKSELELLNCNRQYVFKTHKGEQVFEDSRPKEQTVTDVITGLNVSETVDKEETKKDSSGKERDKKSSSSSKKRERSRDRKSSNEKSDGKERRRDKDKDKDKKRRSRSRDRSRHGDRKRSRSRDRDRHRKSSHKSSKHKKEVVPPETKLDKKSKEILEQLVDKQIVPPLEDRLWKEEVATGAAESESDHEPSSTVTIPTPPRNPEADEPQVVTNSVPVVEEVEKKEKEVVVVAKPAAVAPAPAVVAVSPKVESIEVAKPAQPSVWTGIINMVDVAQISITAHEISGDCSGLNDELPGSLDIVGRIIPETVWDYIGKMKCLNSKTISLLRLNATNIEEKMPYIALYSYLSTRSRLGVVRSLNKAVKDFYIMPLGSTAPIPPALLPLSGAGFEDNRPPLLIGIIVRDKRKRPMLDSITNAVLNKKTKLDVVAAAAASPAQRPATPPPLPTTTTTAAAAAAPARSYTPPPNRDPRIKALPSAAAALPPPPATHAADEDEPYSPEDSDPEATTPPLPITETSTKLPTPPVKSNASFLSSQAFKPFSNKFNDIPGLDLSEPSALPANTVELQRKMAELDQRIAMQQAEIQNMSQDIVSSATASGSDIGTTALANIALPNNLQQILESIKIIGAQSKTDTIDLTGSKNTTSSSEDLTIPLLLPKISSRLSTNQRAEQHHQAVCSPTIPLNLPKPKSKACSPQRASEPSTADRPTSSGVLSSLSEEDLIRKAAEMLGENGGAPPTSAKRPRRGDGSEQSVFPTIVLDSPSSSSTSSGRSKIDLNQPPIPGLEDEP